MKSKKIFNRLVSAFVMILVLLMIVGITGIYGILSISSNLNRIFNDNLLGIQYVGGVNREYLTIALYTSRMTTAVSKKDASIVESAKREIESSKIKMNDYMDLYDTTTASDTSEQKALASQLDILIAEYLGIVEAIYELSINAANTTGDVSETIAKTDEAVPVRAKITEGLEQFLTSNEDLARKAKNSADAVGRTMLIIQSVLLVFGVITAIALGFIISTRIEKDLKVVISKLTESTKVVDSASTQLMEASESLANGSSRQAASIEETSATMNESASMVKQTTENTRQAAQLAKTTSEGAGAGMEKMTKMVESMENIKESSDTMSRTVKLINDIAFQTNLLAINATVEAARAGGEAGRSFGVVAEEVRNLAQRSQKAAEDTSETIERNIFLSNQGSEASQEVFHALQIITKDADELTKLINEINAASEEQASGIAQINQAITQMEKVTQQNAAVSEENAASAGSLGDEIANMREAVKLAEEMVRNSDSPQSSYLSSSDLSERSKSTLKTTQTYTPSPKRKETKAVKTVKEEKEEKAATPAPRITQRTPTSSSAPEKNPEKIIPLDDDDTF